MNPFAGLTERPKVEVPPKRIAREFKPREEPEHINPWSLTPAEAKVMETLADEGSTHKAASALKVSNSTVENHTRSVKQKMGATTTMLAVLTYDRWNRE